MKPIEKLIPLYFIDEDAYGVVYGRKTNPCWQENADIKINELVEAVNYLLKTKEEQYIEEPHTPAPTDIAVFEVDGISINRASNNHVHDKCYSSMVLASNPPQRNWVCRTCGEIGADKGEYYDYGEYERLIEKFKAKENK